MALAALSLCSCGKKTVFMEYEDTPLSGWEKNDTISFCVPPLAEGGDYDLSLLLRTDNSFPFMSVVMLVDETVIPSFTRHSSTLKCELTDKRGITKGKGINLYQHSFPIATRHLAAGDSIHVTVRHNMKREILPGMANIGLSLTKR